MAAKIKLPPIPKPVPKTLSDTAPNAPKHLRLVLTHEQWMAATSFGSGITTQGIRIAIDRAIENSPGAKAARAAYRAHYKKRHPDWTPHLNFFVPGNPRKL